MIIVQRTKHHTNQNLWLDYNDLGQTEITVSHYNVCFILVTVLVQFDTCSLDVNFHNLIVTILLNSGNG